MDYNPAMLQILRTAEFDTWLATLRDKIGQKQVLARLARLSLGHWGDCKPVGGGDKSSQDRDIAKAQHMVTHLKE